MICCIFIIGFLSNLSTYFFNEFKTFLAPSTEGLYCNGYEMVHWEKFFMYKPKIGIDVARFLDLLVVQIQILVYWNQISNLTFPQYELEELVLQSQFLDLKCNNFA